MPTWKQIANKLDKMQAQENQGRGITCVRDIVMYLIKADDKPEMVENARLVCRHEADKVSNYKIIARYLQKILMGTEKVFYASVFA